jgi:hypothetical protein
VQFLLALSKGFAGALFGVLIVMSATYLLGLGPFEPWMALCIAVSTALAVGAKAHWQLSQGSGAALVGLFVGVGVVAGLWLSAHA